MYKILTLNQISKKGLNRLSTNNFELAENTSSPDAILLRSHKLQGDDIAPTVKAIGRAGAGTNNIPVSICTERGIPVFNSPGANANAVKELVIGGLALGSRGILDGISYVNSLSHMTDAGEMAKLLEKEKKRFKGNELAGRTLGVVGLGAIGSMIANAALNLGMDVIGFDPALSVDAAWRLPSAVQKMENIKSLFARADYITLHLPVLEETRGLVNLDLLDNCKPGCCLLNFAREEIVSIDAVLAALDKGKLRQFITDFPVPSLIGREDVILMPHIGASTDEAEENCAVMAADQISDFLLNGNIKNSVNFPNLQLERSGCCRLAVVNHNVPKMLGSILSILADANINIIDMLNKSRDDIAYSLIDLGEDVSSELITKIELLDGVINVRVIH
ncbi:D-3-phosphoglycerate dehydrogenase [Zhongshania aliphaticivorans]|uniref:D-3-phosphoglycerate dehydrogenase n=1 Tax=Zhongshania aliphaticivorans TaxID=1470434 RepID=A0A5S9NYV1_9GAMM|nr:phosphoglycerate dehydrogenase [Zhongshania aliphaticivorans]CAA0089285.1 D-3-phosphoglycerate dehydrogenase [Zhongshania aliphaticivorans]CAA0095981.1 D-3-phosphoglycerate dehydrogenase [Zhongshania aliphaticivorans]